MKKIVWAAIAFLSVGVAFLGWRYHQLRTAAALWEGPVPEILSEKLDKDTDTMSFAFTSRIDAPVDLVMQAFSEPERAAEFSNNIHFSKLIRSEGNKKTVEFEMVILRRPQQFSLEFTFFPEERRIAVKTVENPLSDLSVEYHLVPSPDGMKTLLTYNGTSKDKTNLPIPLALQKSALRETFVAMIQALKKGIAARQNTPTPIHAAS